MTSEGAVKPMSYSISDRLWRRRESPPAKPPRVTTPCYGAYQFQREVYCSRKNSELLDNLIETNEKGENLSLKEAQKENKMNHLKRNSVVLATSIPYNAACNLNKSSSKHRPKENFSAFTNPAFRKTSEAANFQSPGNSRPNSSMSNKTNGGNGAGRSCDYGNGAKDMNHSNTTYSHRPTSIQFRRYEVSGSNARGSATAKLTPTDKSPSTSPTSNSNNNMSAAAAATASVTAKLLADAATVTTSHTTFSETA